ncbi:acetyl-CoA hydrolase/transferase family protein [Roseomonas fluvialis]|nr:acetyl-CoA hydrolase/transferase C-terminal domain-containing protein [Roseomonas fluvialis]
MHTTTGGKTPRLISPEQAAALVRPGHWLDYTTGFNQPDVFDRALAARVGELHDVNIRNCLSMRPRAVIEADPDSSIFRVFNWHFSGYDRKQHDAGRVSYIPCNLGEIPDYYRRFIDRVDIAVMKAAPMDADGYFNLGPICIWHPAVIERATVLVLEIAPQMPPVVGPQVRVHRSHVDYLIEGEDAPMPELPNTEASDVDRAVARLIANEVEDGACLQVGIGGMPNAVTTLLLHSGVKDLGIHTEMLNDGLVELYRAGRVSGARKATDRGLVTYSFSLGCRATYDTLRDNDDFMCRPVEDTNLPDIIARNDRVVAINNTTQVDLQGQAASESDGHRHISGTGGQLQFVRGAYASRGGKSFICLASTYERRGVRKSRIMPALTPGNIVTTPRSDMMYVVTEYGIVNLKGKSVPERAKALIGLAHPDFRDELEREARERGIIPRSLF